MQSLKLALMFVAAHWVGISAALVLAGRALGPIVEPWLAKRVPRLLHFGQAIAAVAPDLVPFARALYKFVVGAPWPLPGQVRRVPMPMVLLALAGLLAGCGGAQHAPSREEQARATISAAAHGLAITDASLDAFVRAQPDSYWTPGRVRAVQDTAHIETGALATLTLAEHLIDAQADSCAISVAIGDAANAFEALSTAVEDFGLNVDPTIPNVVSELAGLAQAIGPQCGADGSHMDGGAQ